LLAGYASGAHARWRTLHEIAVVALFIAQEDNSTAERYVHHRFVKSYEDAVEYLRAPGASRAQRVSSTISSYTSFGRDPAASVYCPTPRPSSRLRGRHSR
jgi:hypothetical protein